MYSTAACLAYDANIIGVSELDAIRKEASFDFLKINLRDADLRASRFAELLEALRSAQERISGSSMGSEN